MKLAEAYKVLGVPPGASRSVVQRAKRDLLRKWHPDRHTTASASIRKKADENTRRINAASDVIEQAGYPARAVPADSAVSASHKNKRPARPRTDRAKKKISPSRVVARTPLAIYRLKLSSDPHDTFAGALDLTEHPDAVQVSVAFSGASDFSARLVVRHAQPELPAWHKFLDDVATNLAQRLVPSAANSAVLVMASAKARYAITFGYGRALLAPAAIERNFGLKVALALIDPASMMSVGFKEVEHTTFFSNRQSNRRVRFRDFRVDTTAAMLGGVAGLPDSPETNFTKAAGTDALHINPAIEADELPGLLLWLEKVRADAKYKKLGFDWIDQVSAVRDPVKVDQLKQILDKDLASGAGELFMGPPEPVDHYRVSEFTVVGLRKQRLDEVTLDDVKQARSVSVLSSAVLDEARIVALDDAGESLKTWSAFDWLAWSHQTANTTYLLQAGVFYEVDRRLERTLDTYLRQHVKAVPTSWPDWTRSEGEDEDVYNRLLASQIGPTATLLDKDLLRQHFAGRGALEVCDVLVSGSPLKFVAVKRFGGPSAVSHVIAQALNGVISILDDGELRAELAGKLGSGNKALAALQDLTPEMAAVYVLLLTEGARRKVTTFPFFAKLTIVRAVKEARARGIEMFVGTRSVSTKTMAKAGRKRRAMP